MTQNYITLNNVVREYRSGQITVRAADGISFSLDKGKFSIIVGPSGAGKTTVLNILGGMDNATSGEVSVDSRDLLESISNDTEINDSGNDAPPAASFDMNETVLLDLDEMRITAKSIELSFHIFDKDNWDTVLDTEAIKINF